MWGGMDLVIDPYSLADSGSIRYPRYQLYDALLAPPVPLGRVARLQAPLVSDSKRQLRSQRLSLRGLRRSGALHAPVKLCRG